MFRGGNFQIANIIKSLKM